MLYCLQQFNGNCLHGESQAMIYAASVAVNMMSICILLHLICEPIINPRNHLKSCGCVEMAWFV